MPKKYNNQRPNIPAEVERKIKIDAGHKCTITNCNEHNYLVIHHINWNREDNSCENLILLCDKHHKMAHDKIIDRKSLREYKLILANSFIKIEDLQNLISKSIEKDDRIIFLEQQVNEIKSTLSKELNNAKSSNKVSDEIGITKIIKELFSFSSSLVTKAKILIQNKQYDDAITHLKNELEINPKNSEGFYLIGLLYGEKGDIPNMINNYDRSLSIKHKYKKNICDNRKYYWAKRFNDGVVHFNKASKIKDTNLSIFEFDKAIIAFKESILCQPNEMDTYTNLAFTYVNIGQKENALTTLDKQIELYKKGNNITEQSAPLDVHIHSVLADSYGLEGEILTKLAASTKHKDKKNEYFDKAIAKMKEAKIYFPDDPTILLHLSNSYIATDKLDIAMESFKEGVEKDSENKYYRFNYGSMLLNVNDFEKASEQLGKAVDIDHDYENAIYNLAITYVKWGATLRENAIKEEKEEDQTYLEKYKLALPSLEKYVQIDPQNGQFWDLLFKVYTNIGMNDKAKEALKQYENLKNQKDCKRI